MSTHIPPAGYLVHPGYTPDPTTRAWWRLFTSENVVSYLYMAFSELTSLLGMLGTITTTRLSVDGDGEIIGGLVTNETGTVYIRLLTASEVEAKLTMDQLAAERAETMRKLVQP